MSSEWLLKIIPKGWAWLKNLHERRKQRITQKHFELNNRWLEDAKTRKMLKSVLECVGKPMKRLDINVTYSEKFLRIYNKESEKLNIDKVEFESEFTKAVKEKVDFDFETFQKRVETSSLSLKSNDSFCFYYDPEKKSMTNINDRVEQCGRPFNLKCYFADSELSDLYPVEFLPIPKPPLEPSPTPKLVSEVEPLPVAEVKPPMRFTYTDGAFYVERTVDKPVEILDITFNSDFVKEIKRIVDFNFEAFQGIVEGRFFSLASDCHCHCFHFTPLFKDDVYTTNMRECALLTKSDFRLKVVYVLALDKTNRRTEEFTARFSDIEIYKQYSFSDVRHHLPADPNYVPF